MANRRKRPLIIAAVALVVAWIGCWGGYMIAKHSKMTLAKLRQYEHSLDWAHMSAEERMKALRALVDKINALSPDERRHWHLDHSLMDQLTEADKSWLLDAVMPTEMKLALNAFEKMPKEKRQKAIDQAMSELKKLANDPDSNAASKQSEMSELSPELQAKVKNMGLNALYSQSSAETKAELQPLLIEMQRQFESGRLR